MIKRLFFSHISDEVYNSLNEAQKENKDNKLGLAEKHSVLAKLQKMNDFKKFATQQKIEVNDNHGHPNNEVQKFLSGAVGADVGAKSVCDLIVTSNEICENIEKEDKLWVRDLMFHHAFNKFGKDSFIKRPFYFSQGHNISIGDDTFFNRNVHIVASSTVDIGSRVEISPNVTISTANHVLYPTERKRLLSAPVTIEDDVWIGTNVTILPGVTIHKGSVIGAGSVVTKDIDAYSVAFGNPCKIIKRITEDDKLENILKKKEHESKIHRVIDFSNSRRITRSKSENVLTRGHKELCFNL